MWCSQCGAALPETAQFCDCCGRAAVGAQSFSSRAKVPTSGRAVASLVTGILGAFWPSAVAAIVLGHISRSEIRRSNGLLKGRGMAIVGLVLGYVWFGIDLFPFIYLATKSETVSLLSLCCFYALVFVSIAAQDRKIRRMEAEAARRATEAAKREEEDARQAAEDARQKALQRHRERQLEIREELLTLGDQTMTLFESLPGTLNSANAHLDQAEVDFSEGAFAPFWDSIEKTVIQLGRFDNLMGRVKQNSARYSELRNHYEDVPPEFPIGHQLTEKLGVGNSIAQRMKSIVRSGQRNYQFASIYEQRKTNQILGTGFRSLAQALDRVSDEVAASINGLADSVAAMSSNWNESMQEIRSSVNDVALEARETSQHQQELMRKESQAANREQRVLEILDNIQRGRRPAF